MRSIALAFLVAGLTLVLTHDGGPVTAGEKKAPTLQQRVDTLEQQVSVLRGEMVTLRKIKTQMQRGTYRMGEIDADVREIRSMALGQQRRLALGKSRMDELQQGYARLLDTIIEKHPETGPQGRR